MRYYLWLNNSQAGPYELHEIKALFERGSISGDTLCIAVTDQTEWKPVSTTFPFIIRSRKEPQLSPSVQNTPPAGCGWTYWGCLKFFVIGGFIMVLIRSCQFYIYPGN